MQITYKDTYISLINEWNEFLLLQSRKENYTAQLKKLNLSQQQFNKLLNLILSFNNIKKELMAVKWLKNNTIKLPEDLYKLDEAIKLVQKYKLDYQQFNSPMQLINSVQNKEQKYEAQHAIINPDDIPQFSHKVEHGDGVVTYWVEDSKAGQEAVRKMIDQYWGYNANPWCLAARSRSDDDPLQEAFSLWDIYNCYPKRIAFKDGKLFAFSANDEFKIVWWDRNDKSYTGFPNLKTKDKDIQYLKKQQPRLYNQKLAETSDLPIQLIQKLANDQHQSIRYKIASRNDLPIDVIQKLANDKDSDIRLIITQKNNLPQFLIQKLANDKDKFIRTAIVSKNNLPLNVIQKLANDQTGDVRSAIAQYQKNLPQYLIQKLANDPDSYVRWGIAQRNSLSQHLIQKLANDESRIVRQSIAKNIKNLSKQLIQKLANDQSKYVRNSIAARNDLSYN